MKLSSFGSTDWRSIISLGVVMYIGTKATVLTVFLGPFTRSFQLTYA